MKNSILGTVLILTFLLTLPIFAQRGHGPNQNKHQGPHMGMGPGIGLMNDQYLKEIGVAEEIRVKIRSLMKDLRKDMLQSIKTVKEKRLVLRDELLKETLNIDKIKAMHNEIAELHKQQQIRAENKKIEIIQLLTLEQRKKVIAFAEEREKRFFKKMQNHFIEEE